jgi:hypothetical protein
MLLLLCGIVFLGGIEMGREVFIKEREGKGR